MRSIDLLLDNAPSWVTIEARQSRGASIIAAPPMLTGRTSKIFHLDLRSAKAGGAAILEQIEYRQLPAFCLERHINRDGTFCLFLDSEGEIVDANRASVWWSGVSVFFANQRYAQKHGVWPLEAGLSHGDAAQEQLAMEELAESLGWRDDLLRAIFRGKGWIADRLPRIDRKTGRVLNARAPCPRGCTWKHGTLRKQSCNLSNCHPDCQRQHKPKLRADCSNRKVIEELTIHEHRRRKKERAIVDELVQKGRRCCGTMKTCPLRDRTER